MLSSTGHTEPIVVFPLQQWLRERPILPRYTYVVCIVKPRFESIVAKAKYR